MIIKDVSRLLPIDTARIQDVAVDLCEQTPYATDTQLEQNLDQAIAESLAWVALQVGNNVPQDTRGETYGLVQAVAEYGLSLRIDGNDRHYLKNWNVPNPGYLGYYVGILAQVCYGSHLATMPAFRELPELPDGPVWDEGLYWHLLPANLTRPNISGAKENFEGTFIPIQFSDLYNPDPLVLEALKN